MKKIVQKIVFLLAVAIATSCSDDQKGKVISQDLSYEIDKDYVFVDIPPKFDFNPANVVYLKGQTILTLTGMHGDDITSIKEGNQFTFNIKLKRAFNREVVVRLKEDHSLLDNFVGSEQHLAFPEGTIDVQHTTIPQGSTEATAVLNIQNTNILKEKPGYILPLRLELVDESEDLIVSTINYSIFVQLNIEFGKDNIEASNAPIEGTEFNDIIEFDSDKTLGLDKLHDGDLKSSWYPRNEETYVTMKLPEPMKILGFKINVKNNMYMLGEFNVSVEEPKGMISYGKVKRNTKGEPIYIKFKNPVNITAIKLDGMLTIDGSKGPDIYEINFIK